MIDITKLLSNQIEKDSKRAKFHGNRENYRWLKRNEGTCSSTFRGEPLMKEDILDIIQAIKNRGMRLRLATNGRVKCK